MPGTDATAEKTLQAVLDRVVTEGRERGVQLAAYHKGRLVVDIAAGNADVPGTQHMRPDTLVPFFSVTKGLATTLAHILIDRKQLSYETRIADVWPEFGVNGKEEITFGQALSHKAGMQLVPQGLTLRDFDDWDKVVDRFAKNTPAWKPGSRLEYHAVTHGWLLGEVMRRIDGRPFPQMLREEICEPLGITNLYCGLPESRLGDVAELDEVFEPGKEPNLIDDGTAKSVPTYMLPLHAWMNKREGRLSCLPASSGIGDARSLAKHYAALHRDGVDGVRLLSPETVQRAIVRQLPEDPAFPTEARFGFGYGLGGAGGMYGTRENTFGHGGYGGAIGLLDWENGLAVGLNKNLYSARGAGEEIVNALYTALGLPR